MAKSERWQALRQEAEALGVTVDGRWSEATLEAHVANARAPVEADKPETTEEEPEMSDETEATAPEMPEGDKLAYRMQLAAKLSSMQPGVVISAPSEDVDADIATLTERIEKIQREQLAKRCEQLGVPPDPKWSIDRFHEEIEKALVPAEAPEGVNLVQVGVNPDGPWHKIVCTVPKVHLGNGQALTKRQKALVDAETAGILDNNDQCEVLETKGDSAPAESDAA